MQPYDSLTIQLAGSNLIEASAGTGKTFAIACLYLRFVVEQGLLPENILVVTFTEAATKELRGRIRQRLRQAADYLSGSGAGDEFYAALADGGSSCWPGSETALRRIDAALQTFDCAAIFTIHGFCSRSLQEHSFESGALADTELITDQDSLLREIVDDFWRATFFGDEAPLLATVLRHRWRSDDMARFLKGKLGNPELILEPRFSPAEIDQLDADCTSAYRRLQGLWLDMKRDVAEILLGHKGLSRSKDNYHPELVPELLAGMDQYLADGSPFELFDGIEKFTAQYIAGQALKRYEVPCHEFFERCGELLALVERRFVALKASLLEFARQRLADLKVERTIRFYDDLLTDLYRALEGPGGEVLGARLRERYRAALIDEFQDTDPVQYRIFRSIFGAAGAPLFLIGDPKQAIYSFRGADIFAYLKAKDDIPPEHRYTMNRNWRSSPGMVDAVGHLFRQQNTRPFIFPDIGCPEVKAGRAEQPLHLEGRDPAPLQIWFLGRRPGDGKVIPVGAAAERIVELVAAEIAGLVADGRRGMALIDGRGVLPGDIAVLVRSHDQAALVQNALNACRIPSVVQSTASLFATEQARDMLRVLEAIVEPTREVAVRTALVTELFEVSANEIATLDGDDAAWEVWLDRFRDYHGLWRDRGFMTMFRSLLAREGVRERLLRRPDGERRLTNVLHCGEVIHEAWVGGRPGMDALCSWFAEKVCAPPENEEYQIRLESDERAVRIVTIHVSKGLEYPLVFCPFSWGGIFDGGDTVVCHDGYRMVADFGSEHFERRRAAAADEDLAENIRLLYVALTRAKYRCWLVWGRFRRTESSAPAYLLHFPGDGETGQVSTLLAAAMGDISDTTMVARLEKLSNDGKDLVTVTVEPVPAAVTWGAGDEGAVEPCFTPFDGTIETDWRVASFTSFAAGHRETAELPDRDRRTAGSADAAEGAPAPEGSMFAFPRGAGAGTFLHAVFEELDFSGADSSLVRETVSRLMRRHGVDDAWLETVSSHVSSVLAAPITVFGDSFCLGDISPKDRLTELEFFFPLKFVESRQVAGVLEKAVPGVCGADLRAAAERLAFGRVRGMVRGFMDLVFRRNGRYYLLDWKSNHLGNRYEDYTPGRLAMEMTSNLYHFQYLLYTVALNRFLSSRDPSYSYESNFGGAMYLFLRGISPDRPGNGVYHAMPSAELVEELTACLLDWEGGRDAV